LFFLINESVLLNMLCKIDGFFPKTNASIKLAKSLPLNMRGPLSKVLSQAEDLKTCLNLFLCAEDLVSDQSDVQILYTENELIFQMNHQHDAQSKGLLSELAVALAYNFGRNLFGPYVLSRVCFRHSQKTSLSEYDDFFKVPIEFNQDYNALVFNLNKLNSPNLKGMTLSSHQLTQQINEMKRKKGILKTDDLVTVMDAIQFNAKKGDYSVSGLADKLSTSTRNLQRHLKKSDANARVLIDQVRNNHALELLVDEQTSIESISEKLSFDSVSGFNKAFKKWNKVTPAHYRKGIKP